MKYMLKMGVMEVNKDASSGFCSNLFLVEGGIMQFESNLQFLLNKFVQETKFRIKTVILFLLSITKGSVVFSFTLLSLWRMCTLRFLSISRGSTVPPFHSQWSSRFSASDFWLLLKYSPVFMIVSAWAHSRGFCHLHYLDDWLVIAQTLGMPQWMKPCTFLEYQVQRGFCPLA